jgi:predicted ArsR family transcriptional regulator
MSRSNTPEGRRRRPSGRAPASSGSARPDAGERRQVEADALADPTRYRLFQRLEASVGPVGVDELTGTAGVHHTVVRQHLAKLRDAGLIVESTAVPQGRGRPRLLYSLNPEVARRWQEADHYQRLAGLLADALRRGVDAREMGRLAGADAARTWAASHEGVDIEVPDIVVAESARMGFEPSLEVVAEGRSDVVLHHCPFRDVAADDPETVCSLHLGIAEGVASEVGGARVDGITVHDPFRAGCRLHLRTDDG